MTIQIDDGEFTRIHNDILDGLAKARFTAMEFRCLFFLVRMTYGWQKKEDTISLSQWAAGIGIDDKNRGNVLNTLNGLVTEGVIYTRSNGNNRPATWGLKKSYFDNHTVMQPHNSIRDESQATVIPAHNSAVMQPHNSTVIPAHNTLAETVMQPHNHKRKVLKKELKKVKESTATQPFEDVEFGKPDTPTPVTEKPLTPQQAMYGAICEALGWDYHVIAEKDKVQVAQAVKILTKANYTVEDIGRFMVDIWFHDFRWEKFQQRPTLGQLRQEIGKLRAGVPETVPRNGAVVDKNKAAADQVRSMLVAHGREDVLRGQT